MEDCPAIPTRVRTTRLRLAPETNLTNPPAPRRPTIGVPTWRRNHEQRSRHPSLATLVSELAQQVTTLLQAEGRLLRAEISEKASKAGAGAVEILGGAICLLQALVIALASAGLGAGWSSLLVGVIVALLGVTLLRNSMAGMTVSELTPDRTQDQLKRDARVIKEQLR
ncbi:MAG: phage holin family protein [Mesorhizobium sp.]|nr:MAG: phage holin family protein [Mesorhizobium sp.]